MFDEHHKKENPTFTGITRGIGGFGFGASGGGTSTDIGLSKTYWISGLETNNGDGNRGYGVAVDNNDGSVYAAGVCRTDTSGLPNGKQDLYLVKYSKSGVIQWQRLLKTVDSTNGRTYGRGVDLDGEGNVYVCAHSQNSSKGGSGNGYNIQLAKFNSSGTIQWQRSYGQNDSHFTTPGMKVTSAGDVYIPVSAALYGSGIAVGRRMGFVKYNSSGTKTGQTFFMTTNSSTTYSWIVGGLDVDSSDNVYLCGYGVNTTSSDPEWENAQPTIVKFRPTDTNTAHWAYYFTTSGVSHASANSIRVNSSGDVFVAGTLGKTSSSFSNNAYNGYVLKIPYDYHDDTSDTSGIWCKKFITGGSVSLTTTFGDNSADNNAVYQNEAGMDGAVKIDNEGNVIAVGKVDTSVQADYLMVKLNPSDGSEIWTRILGNTYNSDGNLSSFSYSGGADDYAHGLAIDSDNNIYVNGEYTNNGFSGNNNATGKGSLIAKLPGDGSLYDAYESSSYAPANVQPEKHGGRYMYRKYMNESGWALTHSAITMNINELTSSNRKFSTGSNGFSDSTTSMDYPVNNFGYHVSVIKDNTKPTVSYDYSFLDEVHYGDGTSDAGGTQTHHYSGDGTMPSINLGSNIQNWDMFFELYMSRDDENAGTTTEYMIGNDGFTDGNGMVVGLYQNHTLSIGHPASNAGSANDYDILTYNTGSDVYTAINNPLSTEYLEPMINQWNWFKLEWRGGSSFKIWHKTSPDGTNYNQKFSTTTNVYNGTDWNFISIGRARETSGGSFSSVRQFHGKMKNFGLNVNSNVVNL